MKASHRSAQKARIGGWMVIIGRCGSRPSSVREIDTELQKGLVFREDMELPVLQCSSTMVVTISYKQRKKIKSSNTLFVKAWWIASNGSRWRYRASTEWWLSLFTCCHLTLIQIINNSDEALV